MRKKKVLSTYTAPQATLSMAGVRALEEQGFLRTMTHHVIHPSSGFKVWTKDGKEGRVTFGGDADEEVRLVRRKR